MANNVTGGLPNPGKTYHGGTPTEIGQSRTLEGTEASFQDTVKVGNEPERKVSGQYRAAVLVRNSSGVNLKGGRLAAWQSNFRKQRIAGYTEDAAQECAGVIDPDLPATGVAPDDLFWLFRGGPCFVTRPPTGTISESDAIAAADGTDATNDDAGFSATIPLTSVSAAVNNIGRAMEAVADGDGKTRYKVDLELR